MAPSNEDQLSTDELFASLGGSLMKDLWTELQVGSDGQDDTDDMGFTLEQLEQELTAHLGEDAHRASAPPADTALASPPGLFSAASLVVSHQQEQQPQSLMTPPPTTTTTTTSASAAADAWSQSLEKFTALSLEQDFLAADSARKTATQKTAADTAALESMFAQAEDYNVSETPTLAQPPPGWGEKQKPRKPPGMPSPSPKPKPTVQVTSSSRQGDRSLPVLPDSEAPTPPIPPTPQNSSVHDDEEPSERLPLRPNIPLPKEEQQARPPSMATTAAAAAAAAARPVSYAVPTPVIAQPVMAQPIVAQPIVPQPTAAWQPQRPPPPPVPLPRVYCDSHPSAPPIPATALESSLMTARDISFILHAMLKPILLTGTSPQDYDVIFWQKRQGRMASSPNTPLNKKDALQTEMTSRLSRTKEWQETHSTLGHVAKSNVTRPRALLASTPTLSSKDGGSHHRKERAALWKARLYSDQAYQAYHTVVECWQTAAPGTIPPDIQPHLRKLLKCCGIKKKNKNNKDKDSTTTTARATATTIFDVDTEALSLLLKLPKGQSLLSRVLEQALLPPTAVLALLPRGWEVALRATTANSPEETRLFRAMARVVSNLTQLTHHCLLDCVAQVQAQSDAALASTARMEAVHALLRRGQVMAEEDEDENGAFRETWNKTEEAFMAILG